MELKQLEGLFTVCKLSSLEQVDLSREYTFLSRTDDEISLVCPQDAIPPNATEIEPGWRGLKISGTLDFSLVGIIAKLAGILAQEGISVFVVSTYNTDYVFVKEQCFARAAEALKANGYQVYGE